MKHWNRKRVTIDPRLQGVCCVRVAMYWVFCLATVVLLMTCRLLLTNPPASVTQLVQQVWKQSGGIIGGTMLVLPLVLFDLLVITNRFAGPIYRIQQELNKLADGHPTDPMQLRPNDFCGDLAKAYNRVRERILHAPVKDSIQTKGDTDSAPNEADLVAS